MQINLGREFTKSLDGFAGLLRTWQKEARRDLDKAMKRIGQRHKAEAVKRVPVDTSALKQRVLTNTFEDTVYNFVTETGTNVKDYPVYLEFGTKHIAGGRVQALGDGVDITDTQAIHDWPAKQADGINRTSASRDATGGAAGRLRNARGQFLKASPQEQLPWLRPAFNAIREWAVKQIEDAMTPPGAQ